MQTISTIKVYYVQTISTIKVYYVQTNYNEVVVLQQGGDVDENKLWKK